MSRSGKRMDGIWRATSLLACLAALAAIAAAPATAKRGAVAKPNAAGRLDPSFGRGGRVRLAAPVPPVSPVTVRAAATAEGKTLVVANQTLVQLLPSGKVDSGFGVQGRIELSTAAGAAFLASGVAVDSAGRIVVGGTTWPSGTPELFSVYDRPNVPPTFATVLRFLPQGSLDPSFGNGGVASTDLGHPPFHFQYEQYPAGTWLTGIALDALDRPVLTGRYRDRIESCIFGLSPSFIAGGFIGRMTTTGSLDPSFRGTGSFADGGLRDPRQPILDGSGRIFALRQSESLCGKAAGSSTPGLLGVEADGSPNPGIGSGGFQPLPDFEPSSLASDRFGRILLAGKQYATGAGPSPRVLRLTPTGQLDQSFGAGGVAQLKLAKGMDIRALALDRRGRILLAGGASEEPNLGSSEAVSRFLLMRLGSRGKLDRSFGRAGRSTVGFGGFTAFAEQVLPGAGGRILVVGQIRGSGIARFELALSRHLGGR